MRRLLLPVTLLMFFVTACSFLGAGDLVLEEVEVVMDGNSTAVLTIRNRGGASVEWTLSDDAPWLSAIPSQGTLPSRGTTVILLYANRASSPALQVRPIEREPGTYQATVAIASEQGDALASVLLNVGLEPTTNACEPLGLLSERAGMRSSPAWGGTVNVLPVPHAIPNPDAESVRHAIVKFRDPGGVSASSRGASGSDIASQVARTYGIAERQPGPGRNVEVVRIPEGVEPGSFVDALGRDDRVAYAELDLPLFLQRTVPNDPALDSQWGPCRFGLPSAWDVSTGVALTASDAPKTVIAVIDSGVDVDHPDLAARMLPGYDFCPILRARDSGDCASAVPEPGGDAGTDAHGTHVAGIAAAAGNNAAGIAGVAYGGTLLLPVKVFDDSGQVTTVSVVACAIYWAIGSTDPAEICDATPNPNPARILNLSLGGPGASTTLDAAVRDATNRGALVFAASGNADPSLAYQEIFMPASAPGAIAVGSVNSNFERSSFSRFDALGGPSVDLMAPGGFEIGNGATIYSTVSNGSYGFLAGTSMATPYAAGVAALVWSAEPALDAAAVADRLRSTAYASPTWNASEYGVGVVCADRALGLSSQCGID